MSKEQFENLYRKHHERLTQRMIGLVRDQDTARDVAAEAFASAFEKFHTFRGESSFYTWLESIARHKLIELRRRKQPVALDALDFESDALVECDIAGKTIERAGQRDRLRRALRHVPVVCREALVDHVVHGYPVELIARRHRIPVGTVLSRLFTGRKKLRHAWSRLGEKSTRLPMLA